MQTQPDSSSAELTLTPAEVEQFRDALLNAFTPGELEQVVYFGLEEDMASLVERGPARQMVTDLVKWANSNNKVAPLLARARTDNPGNPKLRQFAAAIQARTGGLARPVTVPGSTPAPAVDPTVAIQLNMPCIPTAYYEVLDPAVYPLLTCTITPGAAPRRVRVTAVVDGYSAPAVTTVDVDPQTGPQVVKLKPVLSPEAVGSIVEIRAASLNVRADLLGSGGGDLDQRTARLWLLARSSAPLAVQTPDGKSWQDMSQFLGAFVTPKQPVIQAYLGTVAARLGTQLTGYYGDVEAQVCAIYTALKEETKLVYVQSSEELNTEAGIRMQHVRLPRESLAAREANCADGAVLFASLLLAFSLHPALVIMPEHIIVGWETAPGSGEWHYLDTTKLDIRDFAMARQFGDAEAKSNAAQAQSTGNPRWFRRWPLKQLREELKIFPVE
ncbi:MAG: effector-associated domain EAD1-containing protein [Caldilineaceae bacterium]